MAPSAAPISRAPHELARKTFQNEPLLGEVAILGRAQAENFPVALRLLPAAPREALIALYGYARLVDQIGDEAPGDRLALLDVVEADLDAAFAGEAAHPLLRRLTPILARHALPPEPFRRLIDANRWDQQLDAIDSWAELLSYCQLSANPVGELVLHVFGQASDGNIQRSDAVCSALQVLEHCQDVAEDVADGRCYLPREDLLRHGVVPGALRAGMASPELRQVVALQISRAEALLDEGPGLVRDLRGFAKLAVAGFAAGGRATARALRNAACDPLEDPDVRPRRSRIVWETLRLLLGSGR